MCEINLGEMYAMNRMQPPPQQAIGDFFQKFDQDKNGLIDYGEFRNFVLQFNGIHM